MEKFKPLTGLFLAILFIACSAGDDGAWKERVANPGYLHEAMQVVTDVTVHDIFSPPAVSRVYAYPAVAAYQALLPAHPGYRSLAGQLHGLKEGPQPEEGQTYSFEVASLHALLVVARTMVFSEDQVMEFHEDLHRRLKGLGIPDPVFDRSVQYGEAMARHILDWSKGDRYDATRTYPKYTFTDDPSSWKPTPPAYMDGIEPHWREIRTMVLDSAQQFAPPPPTPFDLDKESQFYKELMEVYEALDADDGEERIAIAQFWDCNPYVAEQMGHVMFASKKITPGGHWMGIAGQVARQADAGFMKVAETYAMTSIALMDAFISCWDEKYRSNLIRPETVINQYIDEEWTPALQTPPFPEYTSGHSVISRAAAITLTDLYGDGFAFADSVEVDYGLPVRSFGSFLEASEEAAVSRLYGGIHYRPAIDLGVEQGEQVGKYIISSVETRKN